MPTFPNPWTATVAPFRLSFAFDAASRVAYMSPRDVASSRPREPPITSGLPVTTPGIAKPLFIEIVSMIHAIVWLSVYTSGAGMSFSGPMMIEISDAYRRVMRSSSSFDISFGLQITPPFAPPYGMPMTAHFHVIQHDRARTSSSETFQWYRMPPLNGPIASLYWTRYPVNTLMCPSSIFTGKCTVSSRRGFFRTSSIPPSKFSLFPARSICSRATSKALYSFAFAMRTASQYPRDIEGGGEYRRPLLNIVLEVRAADSHPPPDNPRAASVDRSRPAYSEGSMTFRGFSPRRKRTTFSSAASIARARCPGTDAATCGVITRFGRSWNGRWNGRPSLESGYVHHVSRAARNFGWAFRWSNKSSSPTSLPRAMFTRIASSFIWTRNRRSTRHSVLRVRGSARTTTSAWGRYR